MEDDLDKLAGVTGPAQEVKAGDVIFRQGDTGRELFIIKSGKVELRIGNRVLDTLSDQDLFGEMALIDGAPRTATAVAITDVALVAVCEKQFASRVVDDLALRIMRHMSYRLRKRARARELMNINAITASIFHEVRQPLAAISARAGAAKRFLKTNPPNLERASAALENIGNEVRRASDALYGMRSLFQQDDAWHPVDINEIVRESLDIVSAEIKDCAIATHPELTSGLPLIAGNRNQLKQVVINLIRNAVDAMMSTTGRARVLRVKTAPNEGNSIVVAVQDSGPGIHPKSLDSIFDAFVTTKPQGMGLGLTLCRMIVDHHGGQLTASSDGKSGALFQFSLPIASPN